MQHSESLPKPEEGAVTLEIRQTGLPLKSLTLDVNRYLPLLEDRDNPEEEQEEFLTSLWGILINFGDLGWGIDPTQAVCGKFIKNTFERVAANDNRLESKDRKIVRGKGP